MECDLCGDYVTSRIYRDCDTCFRMKRKKMSNYNFRMLAKRISVGQISPEIATSLPRPKKHSLCPLPDCRANFPTYEKFKTQQNQIGGNISKDLYSFIINNPCYYCKIIPANGIDRRTNHIGYWHPTYHDKGIPMNVVPCCTLCNLVKGRYDEDVFIRHMHKVAEYNL